MPSLSLHRRLKQATREVVFASPRLLAEYRRRHRWWWVPYVGIVAGIAFLSALFLPLLVPLLDPAIRAEMFRRPVGAAPGREAIEAFRLLLIFASSASLLVLLGSPLLRDYVWCSGASTRAFWPLSDAQLTRGGWVKSRWFATLIFMAAAAWGWSLSLAQPLSAGQWWLLMFLAALHAWLITALCWYAAAHVPQRWNGYCIVVALLFMFFGFPAAGFIWELVQPFPELARHWELLAYALPTGWVCGAIDYAVLRQNPLGWLFLLPVALVTIWAWRWRSRGLEIAEFVINSDGLCVPIFRRGFPSDVSSAIVSPPTASRLVARSPHFRAVPGPTDATNEHVTKRILSGALWNDFTWPNDVFIECWVGRMLTEREKRVLVFLSGGRPRWTYAWQMSWWLCLPAMLGGGWIWYASGVRNPAICLLLVAILAVSEIIANLRQPTGSSLHPLFPIDVREALLAYCKMLLVRVPLGVLPLATIMLLPVLMDPDFLAETIRLLLIVSVAVPGFCLCVVYVVFATGRRQPLASALPAFLIPVVVMSSLAGILASMEWIATLIFVPTYICGIAFGLSSALALDRWMNWDYLDRLPPTKGRAK